ncbi:hypothetical protein NXS98_07140 [Fontisphaera persica]|uniref:hypothetical protein n=1 Tax=Fontisphaera persica TaxID=2974023 RepID=UPI0024BF8F3B|nr:hypothetical protein [Fontisphaera persica]WCJ60892.1 hypothetical protein NXS98_07140 [Fontisphaera persica]
MKLVFLDARELARRFKVCRRTIGRWLSLGLPYYVLGTPCSPHLSEVKDWLERNYGPR